MNGDDGHACGSTTRLEMMMTAGLVGTRRRPRGGDEEDEQLAVVQSRAGAAKGEASASVGCCISLRSRVDRTTGRRVQPVAEPGRALAAVRVCTLDDGVTHEYARRWRADDDASSSGSRAAKRKKGRCPFV